MKLTNAGVAQPLIRLQISKYIFQYRTLNHIRIIERRLLRTRTNRLTADNYEARALC